MTDEVDWDFGYFFTLLPLCLWLDKLLYPYYYINTNTLPFKVDLRDKCEKRMIICTT